MVVYSRPASSLPEGVDGQGRGVGAQGRGVGTQGRGGV